MIPLSFPPSSVPLSRPHNPGARKSSPRRVAAWILVVTVTFSYRHPEDWTLYQEASSQIQAPTYSLVHRFEMTASEIRIPHLPVVVPSAGAEHESHCA